MQFHNKVVIFTPEIITTKKGVPVEGLVVSEGQSELKIELADGSVMRVEKRLCEVVND